MLSMSLYFLRRALLSICALLFVSNVVNAQIQGSNELDVVERVPNTIKKVGPYGAEMIIDSNSIVERTPCGPVYPQSSIKNGETGTVVLQIWVTASGLSSRAKIVETSGFRELDRAAMIGFLGCKFKPVFKDGTPIESWVDLRFTWKIG
jgi:protein TonB